MGVPDAVLRDAFEGTHEVDLDLEIVQVPGGTRLVLIDRGAPLDFGSRSRRRCRSHH